MSVTLRELEEENLVREKTAELERKLEIMQEFLTPTMWDRYLKRLYKEGISR